MYWLTALAVSFASIKLVGGWAGVAVALAACIALSFILEKD